MPAFQLPALRPVLDFAHHFFFDDRFIARHPLAVKGRDEQLASSTVLVAVEAEGGTRSEHSAEVGRPADEVTAGGEEILDQDGVADDEGLAEDRQVQRERAAIALPTA